MNVACLFLLQLALRVEVADAAALAAGRRVEHRVDQRRLAGIHGRVDRALQLVRGRRVNADAAEGLHYLVVARTRRCWRCLRTFTIPATMAPSSSRRRKTKTAARSSWASAIASIKTTTRAPRSSRRPATTCRSEEGRDGKE